MRAAVRRALRLDTTRPEDWATWGLRVFLAGGIAWYFLSDRVPEYVTRPVLAGVLVFGLVAGVLYSGAPTRHPRWARVTEASWLALFALHFVGHGLDFYARWSPYDTFVHALGGIVGGLATYALLRSRAWFWDRGHGTPVGVFAVVLGFVTVGGVVVELSEYAADNWAGTREQQDPLQSSIDDTMTDLIAQTATGVATAALAAAHARERHAAAARGRPTAE